MKWLLNTNVISEGVQLRPNSKVVGWIASKGPETLAISIVTLAELRDGASTVRDEARRNFLMDWIESEVVGSFRDRTLVLTTEILVDWLRLTRRLRGQGTPPPSTDLLIAATARVHEMIVVSRNTRDFASTGVMLFDPWSGQTHHMDSA